jgi:O-6-methylguanine DNA methyltransferase
MTVRFAQTVPESVTWGLYPSPAGHVMIGVTQGGEICRISFTPNKKTTAALKKWRQEWPKTKFVRADKIVAAAAKTINAGASYNLHMVGTEFQCKVWRELLKIPVGETISYGDLAKRIKSPKAARAVGSACGANPVPLIVPCHRVIASDGSLGGFSGGLNVKRALLKAERKRVNTNALNRPPQPVSSNLQRTRFFR